MRVSLSIALPLPLWSCLTDSELVSQCWFALTHRSIADRCLCDQVTFLAVSKLIYQICLELKKNPDFVPDYQHLLIELQFLDRAQKQLQCIKPACHELRRLDVIRALATTCQRPLEDFLTKIKKFVEHLGSWSVKGNRLSGFGRRPQWSMNTRMIPRSSEQSRLQILQPLQCYS